MGDPGPRKDLDLGVFGRFSHGTHQVDVRLCSNPNSRTRRLDVTATASCGTCRAQVVSTKSVSVVGSNTDENAALEAIRRATDVARADFLDLPETCEDIILLLMASSVLES